MLERRQQSPDTHPGGIQYIALTLQGAQNPHRIPKVLGAIDSLIHKELQLAQPTPGAQTVRQTDQLQTIKTGVAAGKKAVVVLARHHADTVGIFVSFIEPADNDSKLNTGLTYETVRSDWRRKQIGQRLTVLGRRQLLQEGMTKNETTINDMSTPMLGKLGYEITEEGALYGYVITRINGEKLKEAFTNLGLDFNNTYQEEL